MLALVVPVARFESTDKVRFCRQVLPGDQLVITVNLLCVKHRSCGKIQARAEVDGQLAADAKLL